MKSIAKNSLYNMITKGSSLVFPLITYVYVAHILQVELMGKVEFARSFTAHFSLIAMLGVVNYGTREVAKYRSDKKKLSHFAHEIMIINIISGVVAYCIFAVCITYICYLNTYSNLLLINSISIILTIFGMEWLYSGLEEYKYVAIRTCLFQIISFILVVLLVHTQDDYVNYAIILVVSSVGSNVLNFVHSRRFINYKWQGNYHFKSHIRIILIMFGMTICVQIFTHLDTTMLGFISGDTSVGLYTAAHKICSAVGSLIVAGTAVIMPRISLYYVNNNWQKIKELALRAVDFILMIGVPATVGLIFLAKPIIIVFSGISYSNAVVTSQILALRVLLSPINTFIIIHLFIPIGKERRNVITTGVAAVTNVVFNMVLIPLMAENGAAIATVIAEIIELVLNLFYSCKLLNLKKLLGDFCKYLLMSFSIAPIYIFFYYLFDQYILQMIFTTVLGAMIYVLMLVLTKDENFLFFLKKFKTLAFSDRD